MANFLDTQSGRLLIGGKSLSGGMTRDEVEAQGLVVFREYPKPPEPRRVSYSPIDWDGHQFFLTATYEKGPLSKVGFAFVEGEADPMTRHTQHRQYLAEQLGRPAEVTHDGFTVSYVFSWGRITASYDPRNNSSLVHVWWARLANGQGAAD